MLKTVFAALLLTIAACATDDEDVNLEDVDVPTEDEHVEQDRGSEDSIPNPPQLKKLTRVPGQANDNVTTVGPDGTTSTTAPQSPNDSQVDIGEPTRNR